MDYKTKWLLVQVIGIIITISLLVTTTVELTRRLNCDSTSIKDSSLPTNITEIKIDRNKTLCAFIRQTAISENKRATVCVYQESIRIDFRQFVGNKASIKGLWLSINEWKNLLNASKWINIMIKEAEKNLKVYDQKNI